MIILIPMREEDLPDFDLFGEGFYPALRSAITLWIVVILFVVAMFPIIYMNEWRAEQLKRIHRADKEYVLFINRSLADNDLNFAEKTYIFWKKKL